jgi:hypothetical protein
VILEKYPARLFKLYANEIHRERYLELKRKSNHKTRQKIKIERIRMEENRKAIMLWLLDNHSGKIKDIAKEITNIEYSGIANIMTSLHREKLVEHTGWQKWGLTPAGIDEIRGGFIEDSKFSEPLVEKDKSYFKKIKKKIQSVQAIRQEIPKNIIVFFDIAFSILPSNC